ncbi:MAG TPA: GNAT family N-acetyltransferase [Xanthomonadales bacterium]|nr:GNAT family N-acetyltransferase [Xanthomonadales bacterium]
MAVNLLAALDEVRYGASALARVHERAARAGYTLRRVDGADDRLAAWIDLRFAPSWWSFEAGAGSAWVAERDGAIAGFAAFGARGLKFRWLRAWRDRKDVGIFGPYGVAAEQRGTGIGDALLTAALCGLRAMGYTAALIPAAGGERLVSLYVRRTGAEVVDEFDYGTGRFRATILASGMGTNARSVLERAQDATLPLDVTAVIANDARAGALDVARAHGVDAISEVWDRATEPRAAYDARVIDTVARTQPQLVLLLGWMHLLPAAFVERFSQTINLHPSFLPLDPTADEVVAPDGTVIPALRGAHALRDTLKRGLGWSGATVHEITAATDRGAVLVRVPVAVGDTSTEDALHEKIRPVEFATVAAAIRRWAFER